MKPQFHEDYQNEHADPLDCREADFNWNELYERFGEAENDSPLTPEQKMTIALRRICDWVLNINYNIEGQQIMPDTLIGRRFIAFAWVMNPELFADSPSLAKLCRKIGVTIPTLARLTGEVSREFGIQNRAQAHAWNRGENVPAE
jgi:hypothetical protein